MSELDMQIRDELDAAPKGTEYGITVVEEGKTIFEHEPDKILYAASLGKPSIAAVAGDLAQNGFYWANEKLTIKEEDKVGGTGILQYVPSGVDIPARDTLHWMLAESDNTAAKMIVRDLGGPQTINRELAKTDLDLKVSGLMPLGEGRFHYGNTTSAETARLLDFALNFDPVYDALKQSHCDYMLRRNIDLTQEPRGQTLRARIEAAEDESEYQKILQTRRLAALYPSKEGTLEDKEDKEGLRHDVAKIGGFTVAVLSRSKLVPRWKKAINRELVYEDHPALRVHGAVGKLLVKHS